MIKFLNTFSVLHVGTFIFRSSPLYSKNGDQDRSSSIVSFCITSLQVHEGMLSESSRGETLYIEDIIATTQRLKSGIGAVSDHHEKLFCCHESCDCVSCRDFSVKFEILNEDECRRTEEGSYPWRVWLHWRWINEVSGGHQYKLNALFIIHPLLSCILLFNHQISILGSWTLTINFIIHLTAFLSSFSSIVMSSTVSALRLCIVVPFLHSFLNNILTDC